MTSVIAKSFGHNSAMLAVDNGGYINGIMTNNFCKLNNYINYDVFKDLPIIGSR